ncbi:MAG: putative Ig domain-containing protein [Chloroflexota bacterium]
MVVYRRFRKLSTLLPLLSLALSLLTVSTPQSAVQAAEHATRNTIPITLYPVVESTLRRDHTSIYIVAGQDHPSQAINATPFVPQTELIANDGTANDYFSDAVAVSGNTVIVGAPATINYIGAAYVFVMTGGTWVFQAKLTASDGVASDLFGGAVGLSGDTAIVGASRNSNQIGAAYIFVRSGTTWTPQQKLTANDGLPKDAFGTSVSIDTDTAIIGAPNTPGHSAIRKAYAFVRSGSAWTQQQELLAGDDLPTDSFGIRVAVSGDLALIGAEGQNSNAGSAYVFARSNTTWTLQQKLTASDGASGDFFGCSVAIDGTSAVIGAVGKSTSTGAAYVFTTNGITWSQQQKLSANDGASGDYFGEGVALSGNAIIVGNYGGSAPYVFTYNGVLWTQQQKLIANNDTDADYFGQSVAIDGAIVVTGFLDNNTRAAYVFNSNLPVITSIDHTMFTAGSTNTFTVTATGSPTPIFSATGLPAWATLNPTTGVLNGTPPNTIGSPFAITITATNGVAPDATQNFTLTVNQAPTITSTGHASFTVDSAGTFNVTATGNPAPTFSATGLPAWATLNTTTGVLSGKPLNSLGSPFAVTLTAANGVLPNATQNFTLTVGAEPLDTVGVFRPSTATFYLRNANTTGAANIITAFGTSTDLPVTGDWNGDGIDTVGFYRSSTGQFFLRDSNAAGAPTVYNFVLGAPGDLPMAGDWNSNGKDGVGVFRPSNGLIYLKNNLTTGFADFQMVLGVPGDVPVAGDWNGDGKDSPGVYRPSLTKFFLSNQVCNCSVFADYSAALGIAGDSPFAGDWNGNGITGIGVFRPSNGLIYLKNMPSSGFADLSLVYGIANDKPVAGHWAATAPTPIIAPTFVP